MMKSIGDEKKLLCKSSASFSFTQNVNILKDARQYTNTNADFERTYYRITRNW